MTRDTAMSDDPIGGGGPGGGPAPTEATSSVIEVGKEPSAAGRRTLNEDWAATITGLVLILLVLAGVITKAIVP